MSYNGDFDQDIKKITGTMTLNLRRQPKEVRQAINLRIKQELKTLLKAVIKNNKDDFGTYDYDGIAQEIIALENSL